MYISAASKAFQSDVLLHVDTNSIKSIQLSHKRVTRVRQKNTRKKQKQDMLFIVFVL